jgi:hypothetical protein
LPPSEASPASESPVEAASAPLSPGDPSTHVTIAIENFPALHVARAALVEASVQVGSP